jgi:hypothetical protein
MAQLHFNPANVAPGEPRNFDPLPAGWYPVVMTASDIAQTKSGGLMAKFDFDVIDGPHKGRKLWGRENVRNANADAERIGQERVRQLQEAVSKLGTTDTVMMHNIPLEVRVKIRPADGQYEAQNEIVAYRPMQGQASQGFVPPQSAAAPASSMAPAQPATGQPAASSTPPWAVKRAG